MVSVDELIKACAEDNVDIVRQYIAEDGDVNIQDQYDYNALILASTCGHLDCMRELIAAGANVNAVDNNGYTALAWALIYKLYDAAQILVEAGTDIYSKDKYGRPAIDHCKNKRVKARLIRIAQRHITAAIKSADKPYIIKGFDTER